MKTPALDRRIVVLGTSVVLLLLALDLVVYLAVQRVEAGSVAAVVDARAALVRLEGDPLGPQALAASLGAAGVPALVRAPDGAVHPSRPEVRRAPAGARCGCPGRFSWPGAPACSCPASSADTGRWLRRVVLLEALLTPLLTALAWLLLRWITEIALAPL